MLFAPLPRRQFLGLLLAAGPVVFVAGGCDPPSEGSGGGAGAKPLPTDDALRDQIDQVLDFTFENRHLNLRDHAAWQILHGSLAYGRPFPVMREGKPVSAIDHVLAGGFMRGWTMEPGATDEATGRRGLRARLEQGSKTGQGHADQWLAVLAQAGLRPDETVLVDGREYTMADWVHQVEWDVPRNAEREYSWTLIGLTAYRPTTHEWTASDGQTWSIARLLEIELEQDINTSACGGSHRLIGITMALNHHEIDEKNKATGVWEEARRKVRKAIDTAREYQNPDGSLSAEYFARPSSSRDAAVDLGATGHTLEFLTLALTREELDEEWVKRAVAHMCRLLRKTENVDLECGALYHAIHGLVLYRQRVFGPREWKHPSLVPATPLPTSEATANSDA